MILLAGLAVAFGADAGNFRWFQTTDRTQMYTPSVVIGEIRKGIVRMPQGQRRNLLEGWLERYRVNYVQRIVPFDADVAHSWGTLVGQLQSKGVTLPIIDSQIAAIAWYCRKVGDGSQALVSAAYGCLASLGCSPRGDK